MWRGLSGIFPRKMIRALVLLCTAILPFAQCHKIHEHMTTAEMLSVFQTEGHESVPSYEVVPVLHTLHRRSPEIKQEVHLKAFGKDINLYLQPTDGLFSRKQLPMWTVTRNASLPDGLHYDDVPEASIADVGDIYQDASSMASILLHQDANGKVLVEGNIGSELVIRPLPERVINEVVSKAEGLHEAHLLPNVTRSKRSLKHTNHHVVFRRSTRPVDDEYSDFRFAYVGGACVVNKRLEKVNSVAIIEDTGGFSGIIVAAHEVGHLLGAVHDGSPPPSYLGGPGAEKCRWEDGYIMSDLRHTEKGFKWSHCSVSSFHHFLNGDTATCLYNAPHEDEALPRVLPGKLLSLDAQCRKDRGTSACFKDDRVCAQLFCFDAGSGYCVAYRPAAEGSPCGDGQYCLNGKCVAEHENIIPDYTQNVPTYVRRENVYNSGAQNRPIYAQYNNTEHRYPWEATTYSTSLTNFKVSSQYPNFFTSTSTNDNPYKRLPPFSTTLRVNALAYNTQVTPITGHTSNVLDNSINYREYSGYDNNGHVSTETNPTNKRGSSYSNYYNLYSTTNSPLKIGYSQNDVNYPKVTPFKYKVPITVTSLATTSDGDQNGRQSYGHETGDGECTDVGSDCAELINRLRTWLCHLQSVKNRCCASLKALCAT
ncbi:uncharacterized protein LOC107263651 isoform X3 [Cephus cinctus]|uniref:Uncharacterized protein LOC107263651 isoform X3 n=1 Tax=Cephus cinctus TaxID=211228 RepID=A0AAJ7RA49_CEPCN|nr:uncharacterized protein LOC107263651 isoform X3 [Cephus cinctus]